MTKRILTPIDGREQSAAIVPVVAALARGAGSTVRLLRVFPVPEHVIGPYGRTIAYVDQEMARLTAEGHEEARQRRLCRMMLGLSPEPEDHHVLPALATLGALLIGLFAWQMGHLGTVARP